MFTYIGSLVGLLAGVIVIVQFFGFPDMKSIQHKITGAPRKKVPQDSQKRRHTKRDWTMFIFTIIMLISLLYTANEIRLANRKTLTEKIAASLDKFQTPHLKFNGTEDTNLVYRADFYNFLFFAENIIILAKIF